MAKIIIDGKDVTCRDGIPVLQAALEAGWDVPHYCYHPALSIVGSCRLCLMEMKMPHPRTREMDWAPKLVPSCQTLAKDGLEIRFDSQKVRDNRTRCMEFFLLNHPLDCPVCDQAGECQLQDYSERFGSASGRMLEAKDVNPKKSIGSKTLLYSDRCVTCSRCIRFCQEIAGTSELCLVDRGSKSEIDVFPGVPLENALQGNVVDICPVGALLDEDFFMRQRVWELRSAASVCPGCSAGCAIHVDHRDGRVYRLKPRFNPGVNDWWMCDEGRFGWKYVHDDKRLTRLFVRRGSTEEVVAWDDLPILANARFREVVKRDGAGKTAALLSPFMACEEAWLLATFVRGIDPEATLAMGPAPGDGEDATFPQGGGSPARFTIRGEKCPNRRGVQRVLDGLGGPVVSFEDFVKATGGGAFGAAWIVGGAPSDWVPKELAAVIGKIGAVVAQDIFANKVTAAAAMVVPSCAWVERSGTFVNCQDKAQPFEAAVVPPEGCRRDGHYLYALAGEVGLYTTGQVRARMAVAMPWMAELHEAPRPPVFAH